MKTIIKTEVSTFDSLNEKAKEQARAWWRENGMDYEWYESTYEDAKQVAALMGIDINAIYFSGFSSQGDGACFECSFEYKAGCARAVKAYAPKDEELHAIARDWQALQKANDYRLKGTTKQQGHYQHEQCTRVTASRLNRAGEEVYSFDTDDSYVRDNEEAGAEAARILRRLMKWVYTQLETEHDYLNDDAQVDDAIKANEYTFTESGKRFG